MKEESMRDLEKAPWDDCWIGKILIFPFAKESGAYH